MACGYIALWLRDRPDPVTIERMIGRNGYLAYLVISGHKNEHKPTRFGRGDVCVCVCARANARLRASMFYLLDSNKSSGNKNVSANSHRLRRPFPAKDFASVEKTARIRISKGHLRTGQQMIESAQRV